VILILRKLKNMKIFDDFWFDMFYGFLETFNVIFWEFVLETSF